MPQTIAWRGFRNGRLPPALLVEVGGAGRLFEREAARYLVALRAAYLAHFGYPLPVLEGYRPIARQDTLWDKYEAYQNGGPYAELAARPGTSNHGYARACDFGPPINIDSPEKRWLDANAPAYGWHPTGNDFHPIERWHFDWLPGTATVDLDQPPAQTLNMEAIMALKDTLEIFQSDRGYFVGGPGYVYDIGDKDGVNGQDKLDVLRSIGVPTTKVDIGTYDILRIVLRGSDLVKETAEAVKNT